MLTSQHGKSPHWPPAQCSSASGCLGTMFLSDIIAQTLWYSWFGTDEILKGNTNEVNNFTHLGDNSPIEIFLHLQRNHTHIGKEWLYQYLSSMICTVVCNWLQCVSEPGLISLYSYKLYLNMHHHTCFTLCLVHLNFMVY